MVAKKSTKKYGGIEAVNLRKHTCQCICQEEGSLAKPNKYCIFET